MPVRRTPGRIAPAMLPGPWTVPRDGPEKHLETLPGAIWAAGWLEQNDDDTLRALVALLDDAALPIWLKGDAVGAVTRFTGKRSGYGFAAWRRWAGNRGID